MWSPPKEICFPKENKYWTPKPGIANWTSDVNNLNRVDLLRPEGPGDYCAIPPNIVDDPADKDDGPVFSNGLKEAYINGNGTVLIKFNTNADPEQIPLKNLTIDWGNGDEPSKLYVPGAPRTDPNNPLVFKKVYVYKSNYCPHPKDSTGKELYPGWCVYNIKIQLCDNWGWCSDASRVGNSARPEEGIAVTDSNKDDPEHKWPNTELWYNSGLTVLVNGS